MIRYLQSGEEAKLRLIDSLAQSQLAMARILGSLADVTELSGETARHLVHNIEVLTKYQEAMARSICGIPLHRIYYGTPSSPWITESCFAANHVARGVQED